MTILTWSPDKTALKDFDSDLTIQEMNSYYSSMLSFMGGYSSSDSLHHVGGRGPLFSEDGYNNIQRFSNDYETFDREIGESVNLLGTSSNPTLSLASNVDSINESNAFSFTLTSSGLPEAISDIFYKISGVTSSQINRPLIGSFTSLNGTETKTFEVSGITEDTVVTMALDSAQTSGLGTISDDIIVREFTDVTRITNGLTIGQAAIFNAWDRFSHSGQVNYPANAGEMATWAYDSASGTISSTINSATYIGFVSSDEYSDYVIQSKITSNNADNDRLGVVIAFLKDSAGLYGTAGREYTLSAIRNQDGYVDGETDSWIIVYNYLQSGQIVANGSSFIPYNGVTNWNQFPDGTTIRVERVGDVVTCYSTDPGSTTLKGAISVDLSTSNFGGVLNKFMGSSRVGFSCFSQGGATFNDLNISVSGSTDLGYFNEGQAVTIDVESRNNDTNLLDYEILYNGSLATDITEASGNFVLAGTYFLKTGSFTFTPNADATSEGTKSYTLNILKQGNLLTSASFDVLDTSV